MQMNIPAAVFKAECLKLMDEVARTGQAVVITKHGRPVAQLSPIPAESRSLFGYMKNTLCTNGDIVAPAEEQWSALSGDEDHLFAGPPRKPRVRRRSGHK
ncbi:MAG: type II toxin-antitoxin system prevent-host-death family antitoxin [Gammaproteobacteria bacterium]